MSRAVGTHTCRPAALGEAIEVVRPCSFEPRSVVSGSARVRVCGVPRSVSRAAAVKPRASVPARSSGYPAVCTPSPHTVSAPRLTAASTVAHTYMRQTQNLLGTKARSQPNLSPFSGELENAFQRCREEFRRHNISLSDISL
ncbi:hypothetical protein EVAR_35263_1 [Eumeta japonica]|uniref:Uncharacterized protein n=1 Tax=Eumeta variegata TaxID=151549 RepID=A0A4C1VEL3_EUMVA|nr:hypothetical protein EVAR_35263_1 [Eumeta japonica]